MPKESGTNRPNKYNYFYYKLFDNNGEDVSKLGNSYKNITKVKLFSDDETERRKYEVLNEIEVHSDKSVDTEDSTDLKSNDPQENCFGPQKNKISIKERNFRPY